MSSDISQTENVLIDPPEKHSWHVNVKSNQDTYEAIVKEAKREDRSMSYVVSRALEKLYDHTAKLKIV